jgi:diguanylate cyclase (GGDEF)-like protein
VLSDVTELIHTQQQLISSRDELKILHEAAQLMNSSLELKNILNKLLEIIKRVVDYYCCRIYLFQQLTGELRLEAEYEQQLDSCQQPTEALLAQIFTTGITISQAGELSSLTIPLIRGSEKLGVICIRLTNVGEVPENVQHLLMNLADLACLAIKNGQKFQRTHELATIDGLTKLYNRQYFEVIIDREINRSQRFRNNLSMVMVDVNGLKEINDRLGHSVGDEILVQTASILQQAVRSIDYVFRYGGDEMVILLLDADEQTTGRVVRRIREREVMWNIQQEQPLPILSLSIGYAVTTGDKTAEELLDLADQRMYADKEQHYRDTGC